MTIREKILVIENNIIDKLTQLTWWVEVKYGKNNVDLGVFVYSISFIFFFAAFAYLTLSLYQLTYYIFSFLSLLVSFFFFITSASVASRSDTLKTVLIRDFPQGCPNPSRHLTNSSNLRVNTVVVIIWSNIIFAFTGLIFFQLLAFAFIPVVISNFLLSCDSLPPEEKARRRATQEMKNLALQQTVG